MGCLSLKGRVAIVRQTARGKPVDDDTRRHRRHDRACWHARPRGVSIPLFCDVCETFWIILRVLKDRAASEDVLQEVYVRLWQGGAETFTSGKASQISWLATIARNRAIDRLRVTKPTRDLDHAPEMVEPSPGPEAQAIASSERAAINTYLGELDPDRAAAVRGAYLDGDTYAELAARFDVPLNTIRTWLRRSLMSLKKCLTR
jgi:RNA polymerase sigma-70 factor (ECF subfamily)